MSSANTCSRAERTTLLETGLRGGDLAKALSNQADGWFRSAASILPPGWTLLATAGYADGSLCPSSDLDVLLLHPKRAKADVVSDVARSLWYPFWDSGLKLSPAVHTVDSVLRLGADDLVTATTLLRLRHLAGDPAPMHDVSERANAHWRKNAKRWLAELGAVVRERHEKAGEVAFLLEPNLKEGRGGLRDVHSIDWACRAAVPGIDQALVRPLAELERQMATLLDARVELHRVTGRASDVLLLQDQDAVADQLGLADADALMASIAETARTIAWTSDRFWERVENTITPPKRMSATVVGAGLEIREGELVLAADVDLGDRSLIMRVAATAALLGVLPSGDTLVRLAAEALVPERPWSADVRDGFIGLLDSGGSLVAVVEALDQYGLFARLVPEWEYVRSRPQRNAYHTYTVDRHLLVTAVRARELVRQVRRPDLLLLGAFLHDIGKGVPGDHVENGVTMTKEMCAAMGIANDDVPTLVALVEHHLLLAETATRRDVSDPGTIDMVARALGDRDTLELLRALTEADSLATGPSAWSDWKRELIDQLVEGTSRRLEGQAATTLNGTLATRYAEILRQVREDGDLRMYADDQLCVIGVPDNRGLFALLTGVLASHGIEVVSADIWTSPDGIALDEFRHVRRTGGQPDWAKVEKDLRSAIGGQFDIEARIERRARTYRVAKFRSAEPARPAVLVDNDTSADATIVEVRATDALALLYRLSKIIADMGLDIRHAKVATLGQEVVDVFYLLDTTRGSVTKLTNGHEDEFVSRVHQMLAEPAFMS